MVNDLAMQKVLFGEPPCDETEATSALFYSITSTQVFLALLLSEIVSKGQVSFYFTQKLVCFYVQANVQEWM